MVTAHSVVGLGFGDEAKGATVDYLVRESGAHMVVKHSGGCQCGHSGIDADTGIHHEFSQIGAGAFSGAATYLSRFFLFEPFALRNELLGFRAATGKLADVVADPDTPIITPYHVWAGREREAARSRRHGSCNRGIGELGGDLARDPAMVVRVADLADRDALEAKLRYWHAAKTAVVHYVRPGDAPPGYPPPDDAYIDALIETADLFDTERWSPGGRYDIVFEGGQGVLLDEWYGFHPHTTWSTTTFENAERLLDGWGWGDDGRDYRRVGCTRTYTTRHGHGPFPTWRSLYDDMIPEMYSGDDGPQGKFRRGCLDLVLLRYALDVVGGVDVLAVSHCDVRGLSAVNAYRGIAEEYPRLFRDDQTITVGRKAELDRQAELADALTAVSQWGQADIALNDDDVAGVAHQVAHWAGHDGPVLAAWGPSAAERTLVTSSRCVCSA